MIYVKEKPPQILFEDIKVGDIFQVDSISSNANPDYLMNVGLQVTNIDDQMIVYVYNLTQNKMYEIDYNSYCILSTIKSKMVIA